MSRVDRLKAFAEAYAEAPVEWGVNDCTMTPARWLQQECGLPLPDFAYGSEAEGHAIMAERGGLLSLWSDWLAEHGIFERIGEPQLGDVAIIDTRTRGHIGGICAVGRVLLIRTEKDGLGGMTFFGPIRRFVKVWAAS